MSNSRATVLLSRSLPTVSSESRWYLRPPADSLGSSFPGVNLTSLAFPVELLDSVASDFHCPALKRGEASGARVSAAGPPSRISSFIRVPGMQIENLAAGRQRINVSLMSNDDQPPDKPSTLLVHIP